MTTALAAPLPTEEENLEHELRFFSEAYYRGESLIPDEVFENKRNRLEEINPQNAFLQTIGAPPIPGRQKVKHVIPMLSLNKVTTTEELHKWLRSCDVAVYQVQPKLDGASMELQYTEGVLTAASTRGDGEFGEDILTAAKKMKGVLPLIPNAGTFAVRGECVLDRDAFALMDPSQTKNPRDVGNGIMRREDGEDAEFLTFVAYGDDAEHSGENDSLIDLADMGFETVWSQYCDALGVEKAIADILAVRPNLMCAIDGAVVKVNDIRVARAMGVTGGRPRGAIAFKWPTETVTTTVTAVDLTVGHTGFIAPTAVLAPVALQGVTVCNATLCNWEEIQRLDVAIGDTVEIKRAGEIIPKVIRVTHRPSDRQPIPEPTKCPVCGASASRKKTTGGKASAQTFCNGFGCDAKNAGKIRRWLSSLNILGIGDELLASLYSTGLVMDVSDLYRLTEEKLAEVPMGIGKVGPSRAKKIVAEITVTKTLDLSEFIGSLGAPFLGVRKAEMIIKDANGKLDTWQAWLDGQTLHEVAEQCHIQNTAAPIADWMHDNWALIRSLAEVIAIKPPMKKIEPARAPGSHVFVLTGKFDVPKSKIHEQITAAGHAFEEDMKKGVTHLVQADASSTSSKTKKAAKMGIEVIDIAGMEALLTTK